MSRQRVIVIEEPKQGDADATVRRCYYSPLLAAPLTRVRAEPCKAQTQVSNYTEPTAERP